MPTATSRGSPTGTSRGSPSACCRCSTRTRRKAVEEAQAAIDAFPGRFESAYLDRFRAKLGLAASLPDDGDLVADLLQAMAEAGADFTNGFRALCDAAEGAESAFRTELGDSRAAAEWLRRWRVRLGQESMKPGVRARQMRRANPAIIPRNHRVEAALAAALEDDLGPLDDLLAGPRLALGGSPRRPALSVAARAPRGRTSDLLRDLSRLITETQPSMSDLAPHLFEPLTIRSVTLRNRIGVSPMCQYSSEDGVANDWHLVHLGARAAGGAALVIAEATAVSPEGRITPGCAGLWADKHIEPLARINRFVKGQGAVPAIQLAHAGRKASASRPWEGDTHLPDDAGGWPTIAPSALAFGGGLAKVPRAMTQADIAQVQQAFVAAAAAVARRGLRVAGAALRPRVSQP